MKTYEKVYGFNVTEKILKGADVMLVDLKERQVYSAATITAAFLIEAIDDNTGRFLFYVPVETKIKNKAEITENESEAANE